MTRNVNQSQCEGITQRMEVGTLDKSCAHVLHALPVTEVKERVIAVTNPIARKEAQSTGMHRSSCKCQGTGLVLDPVTRSGVKESE